MARTIKVIELLNKIANNDKKPYQLKYEGNIYTWDCLNHYVNRKDGTSLFGDWVKDYNDFLNDTVEIIEEQEEIDIQELKEYEFPPYIDAKLNPIEKKLLELINIDRKAIKQIDNKLKEK